MRHDKKVALPPSIVISPTKDLMGIQVNLAPDSLVYPCRACGLEAVRGSMASPGLASTVTPSVNGYYLIPRWWAVCHKCVTNAHDRRRRWVSLLNSEDQMWTELLERAPAIPPGRSTCVGPDWVKFVQVVSLGMALRRFVMPRNPGEQLRPAKAPSGSPTDVVRADVQYHGKKRDY